MWNLEPPETADAMDHLDVLLSGALARHLTADEREALNTGYEWYRNSQGRPDAKWEASALGGHVDEAILEAYAQVQSRGQLSHLRSKLLLGSSICPYCGFGEVGDLDHHLQKQHYKWLSIYALNLVPACPICNRKKPRRPRADPLKQHIHAYLEDIRGFKFLVASAAILDGALTVEFGITEVEGLEDETRRRLEQHFVDFKLHSRLKPQVSNYLSNHYAAISMQFVRGGSAEVRAYLLYCAQTELERHGLNDWRVALLEGVADCQEFCDGAFTSALGF